MGKTYSRMFNELSPMFISRKETAKGEKVPLMLYDPKDYFRILMEIDMPAIINPFGEASFYMSQRFIINVVNLLCML